MTVNILCLAVGFVIGFAIRQIVSGRGSGYGHFKIEPYDTEEEDGFYKINVVIPQEQDLLKVNKIVLTRDSGKSR